MCCCSVYGFIVCSIAYLPGALLFTEVDGEGQVHGGEHGLRLPGLRVSDELPQALVHHRVEEGKVVPVHLQDAWVRLASWFPDYIGQMGGRVEKGGERTQGVGRCPYLPAEQHLNHVPVQGDRAQLVLQQAETKYPAKQTRKRVNDPITEGA